MRKITILTVLGLAILLSYDNFVFSQDGTIQISDATSSSLTQPTSELKAGTCTTSGQYNGELLHATPIEINCTVNEGDSITEQYQFAVQNTSSMTLNYDYGTFEDWVVFDPSCPPITGIIQPGQTKYINFHINSSNLMPGQSGNAIDFEVYDNDWMYYDDAMLMIYMTVIPDPPVTPKNLVATVNGSDVTLTWDSEKNPETNYYDIYRNGVRIAWNVSAQTYYDSGLTSGAYSYYVAEVVSGFGMSDYSNQAVALVNVTGIYTDTIKNYMEFDSGKHYICSPIFVADSGYIKILPGAELLFTSGFGISIFGTGKIEAIGTQSDNILFSAIDTLALFHSQRYIGGWKGIRFAEFGEFPMSINADSSFFKYCHIEFAKGLKLEDTTATELSSNNDFGGGFYLNGFGKISIQNCFIQNNFSRLNGGGICCIASNGNECSPLITNNIINNNYAGYNGAGIFCMSLTGGDCSPQIVNNIIDQNKLNDDYKTGSGGSLTATYGGGISLKVSGGEMNPIIVGNQIADNTNFGDPGDGGGLYANFYNANSSNLIIVNNTFVNNNTSDDADEIYLTLIGNSIVNLDFYSNIIWESGPSQIALYQGNDAALNGNIGYCDIQHGINAFDDIFSTNLNFVDGNFESTCIDLLPQFTNSNNGIYSISELSPCINTGKPDSIGLFLPLYDLANNPRINHDTIDIGAYEYRFSIEISLNLKVFLEGPFGYSEMSTDLNTLGYLPLMQPYGASPWYYRRGDSVSAIPNTDITDWILVELRNSANGPENANIENIASRKAAFIDKSGFVVDTSGSGYLPLMVLDTSNLYVVIYHRNHLPIMSSNILHAANGIYSYDFTTGPDKVYEGSTSYTEIGSGIWGMVAGNAFPDNNINNQDKNESWYPKLGQNGYFNGDLNMDGIVEEVDKENLWLNNAGKGLLKKYATFPCGISLIDSRDGQEYRTVQIGSQCWMAENLNIGIMIEGEKDQINNDTIEKYCQYNDLIYCDSYGGLYKWNEMMQYTSTIGVQGICPSGWHLPTDEEWKQLEGEVDTQFNYSDPEWDGTGWRGFDAGLNLKSTSGWNFGGNGTDEFGFMSLSGGSWTTYGSFGGTGSSAYFWSSSKNATTAWGRSLNYDLARVYRGNFSQAYGFSVRCLRD